MRPGRAADHSPSSSAAVMEQYSYTSTHPLGHTGPVTASLYLLLLLLFITSMQDIYSHIAETNHVPTLYNAAAILLLQYMTHIMLFPTIKLLHRTSALPAVCAQCPVCLFCSVP